MRKVALMLAFGLILGLGVPAQAGLTDGLVAYFSFEDGSNLGLDNTGNGNDGTAAGDPVGVVGKVGNGVEFDGAGDWFALANEANFDLPTAMTVAVWIQPTWTTSWQGVVAKGEGGRWRLARDGGGTDVKFSGNTGNVDGNVAVNDGAWHLVVATFDGANTTASMYIDDLAVRTTVSGATQENGDKQVMIGNNPDSTGRAFNGLMDEVGIWDRALSAAEVAQLWNGGAGNDVMGVLVQLGEEFVWDTDTGDWGAVTDPLHPGESHWFNPVGPAEFPDVAGGFADMAVIEGGECTVAGDQTAWSVTVNGLGLLTIAPPRRWRFSIRRLSLTMRTSSSAEH